jgi:hypothetical protein
MPRYVFETGKPPRRGTSWGSVRLAERSFPSDAAAIRHARAIRAGYVWTGVDGPAIAPRDVYKAGDAGEK